METFDIWFYKVSNHIDCIFSIFNIAFLRMSNKFDDIDN